MEKKPQYVQSPLMKLINNHIFVQRSPQAFALANLGDGPCLAYRGQWCHVDTLVVHFCCNNQRMVFSQQSKPPYFLAVCRKKDNDPLLLSLYQSTPQPLFESEGGNDLTGQIFVYAKSSNGIDQTIAHAVFLPQHAHIFASIGHRDSLLLESHPELCDHLAMCGALIENFLEHQGNHGGVCRE